MLSKEGVWGLYRGFPAVLVGGAPATCIYLTSYEVSKSTMLQSKDGSGLFRHLPVWSIHLACGMFAETVACVVFVPVDVVKERLQVQEAPSPTQTVASERPLYKNSLDALRVITTTEGLKGIYRGYGATLASFGPFSALHFMIYEQLKDAVLSRSLPWSTPGNSHKNAKGEVSPGLALACASMSSSAAAWLTSPLDLVKLRMQVARGAESGATKPGGLPPPPPQQYPTSMVQSLKHIGRTEGAAGLWRGALARVIFTAPHTAIVMATYEHFSKSLAQEN